MPGDTGYAAAALSTQRSKIIFAVGRSPGATKSVELPAGQCFGTYLVQDSSSGYWRAKNPANVAVQDPLAFFSAARVNSDGGFDHVLNQWVQGSNGVSTLTMQWEDQTLGGDRDFNEAVVNATGLQATGAQAMLQMCAALGCMVMLACLSTSVHAVCWADAPNLGLGLDSFHLLASDTSLDRIDDLEPARIFLVQLARFPPAENPELRGEDQHGPPLPCLSPRKPCTANRSQNWC